MTERFDLSERVALVIGGDNAIGRAIAVALAEAGADVAVAASGRSGAEEAAAQSAANEVWALGRRGFAAAIDVSREADVEALVQRVVAELGRLDILVNAQDLPFARPLPETTADEWQRVLDVNLTGVFLATKAAAAVMLARGKADARRGKVINVTSVLGARGLVNAAAYCAAKAGVINLTQALALEWARLPDEQARSGINVNAIGVGWAEGTAFVDDSEVRQQLERYLPYKRLARPEELAGAAVYLASDAADFMTGQVIFVEGGALSHV